MNYYEVAAASNRYHGDGLLTYHSQENLETGAIVALPLRGLEILGIIKGKVSRPKGYTTKAISRLVSQCPLPEELLKLHDWLRLYYPAHLGVTTQQFVPRFLLGPMVQQIAKQSSEKASNMPVLTAEQQQTLKQIKSANQQAFLLHGQTGSGKTRIYIEMARLSLKAGKSALILTPEISLTPQLVKSFENAFPNQTLVTHSNLSDKTRRVVWHQIANSNKPLIVIGPRSALFSPLHRIGLIVLDEFHDGAYKHEQAPYYQSLRVAAALAGFHGAKLIFGSATPGVADYFVAEAKKLPILKMRFQAIAPKSASDRRVQIIGLRDKAEFSRHPYLSNTLLSVIEKAIKNNEQSLLFINRRGSARLVVCQNCGWQSVCPKCDIPLVYHGDKHEMRCHTCGLKKPASTSCPVCKSPDIIYKGIGTKSIELAVAKLFPKAKVQRFDADNTAAERLEAQFENIRTGKSDIIIGTQMLAKGLDLPSLSVVGVIMADAGLAFPDYTASERTYQLLSQVIGRVGRGHRRGNVVIQSYQPKSQLLAAAMEQDWLAFYEQEIKHRATFKFPPFVYLLKITLKRSSRESAQKASQKLREKLMDFKLPVEIIGPSPAFKERTGDKYNWQLVVKSKSRERLLDIIKHLPAGLTYDIDPSDLL